MSSCKGGSKEGFGHPEKRSTFDFSVGSGTSVVAVAFFELLTTLVIFVTEMSDLGRKVEADLHRFIETDQHESRDARPSD